MFQHVRQTEKKLRAMSNTEILTLLPFLCVNFLLFEIHILREQ